MPRRRSIRQARILPPGSLPLPFPPVAEPLGGGYDPAPLVAEIVPMFERLKRLPWVKDSESSEQSATPRVAVFGDSTGAALTIGLSHWLERTGLGQPPCS